MDMIKYIQKYKLNQTMLADVIGVKLPAFTQKMKGDRSSKFSPEQEDKLKKFIRKMAKEAQFCCKSVATIKI